MSKQIPKTGPKPIQRPAKDLSYYITLFTLEGHSTWRAFMSQNKEGFLNDQKNWGKNPTKITKQNTMRIDRLTGQIIPLP